VKKFTHDKVVVPFVAVLKSGATVEKISLSIAAGVSCGVFPVPGTTALVAFVVTYLFKLNIMAVQLLNMLMTPLNFATFIPIVRAGEYIFDRTPAPLSFEPFKKAPFEALSIFWRSLACGVTIWFLAAIPCTWLLSRLLRPFIARLMSPSAPVQVPKRKMSDPSI